MFIYQCALIIKYHTGELVARAPSRGDVCTQAFECLVSPLLTPRGYSPGTLVSLSPQKSTFQISIRFAMVGEEPLLKCVAFLVCYTRLYRQCGM